MLSRTRALLARRQYASAAAAVKPRVTADENVEDMLKASEL